MNVSPTLFFSVLFLQHNAHQTIDTYVLRNWLGIESILTIVEEKKSYMNPIQAYEAGLDKQLRVYKFKKDTLIKAGMYVKDDAKIQNLIDYWRTVAQMASNYVFNEQSVVINKVGGFQEWQRRQWERKKDKERDERDVLWESISEELQATSDENKSAMIDQLAELGFVVSNDGELLHDLNNEMEETPTFSSDFTMRDLYDILNLDYDLVYE